MSSNLHLKIVVLAMVAFGLMLMGGSVSADPDPECAKPTDDNHSAGPELSETSHCVHTVATVGGGGSNTPTVENKWELPDMDPSQSGIQYVNPGATGLDPCVFNASMTQYINTPCVDFNGNDVPNKNTLEHGHFHHDADPCKYLATGCQLTVTPNVDDKPEKRAIEIWAIVSDTEGIGDIATVQAIVTYDPNGEPVKKDTNPTHPVQMVKQSCEDLFGAEKGTVDPTTGEIEVSIKGETNPTSPLHAAVNTGQLPHDKVDVSTGFVLDQENCSQEAWAAYSGYFLLNNDQPWGKYGVCVQAIDTGSSIDELCNKFLVQNIVAFKIDFNTIDWGTITRAPKTVSPGNITNTGNADACLDVVFGEMEGKAFQQFIDDFGAELKSQASGSQVAGTSIRFDTPIESKGVNKLRFTIYPPPSPEPLPPDVYQGRVDLSVKKGPCL